MKKTGSRKDREWGDIHTAYHHLPSNARYTMVWMTKLKLKKKPAMIVICDISMRRFAAWVRASSLFVRYDNSDVDFVMLDTGRTWS